MEIAPRHEQNRTVTGRTTLVHHTDLRSRAALAPLNALLDLKGSKEVLDLGAGHH